MRRMEPGCTSRLIRRAVAGVAVVAVGCSSDRASTSAIPNTPAGRVFREWLDAYNAGDSTLLRRYAQQHEPTMRVRLQYLLRQRLSRWNVVSVERSEPAHLEVVLQSQPDTSPARTGRTVMYGVVRVSDTTTLRATTSLVFLGDGARVDIPQMTKAERRLAIDSAAAKIRRNYVVPDVGNAAADSIVAWNARGVYDDDATAPAFAQRLNDDLAALSANPRLGADYVPKIPMGLAYPSPEALVKCGVEQPRMLADSVGYVSIVSAFNAGLCGMEFTAALRRLRNARALVLDLRENVGLSPVAPRSMSRFVVSHFLDDCTQLTSIVQRASGATDSVWTNLGLPRPMFGATRPLFVLTSSVTTGEAEMAVHDLKRLGRAVVVGEKTAGVANDNAWGRIADHVLIRIPYARFVDPVTGKNWDGIGIEPDVNVPATDALATAERLIREGRTHPSVSFARTASHSPLSATVAKAAEVTGLLHGIQFEVDTTGKSNDQRFPITRVAGTMQFANGRGRFDVTSLLDMQPMLFDGIPIAAPLAKPGDYYLFDNTGFILVRPSTRTFTRAVFTRAEFTRTGQLLDGMYPLRSRPGKRDLVRADDPRLTEHGPITVHWHMQRPRSFVYARGWLDIADAPAVEAGVARWFGAAAALASRRAGSDSMLTDLQVTIVSLLWRRGADDYQAIMSDEGTPAHVQAVDVDASRLVLPAGYTEVAWPGFPRVSHGTTALDHWRTIPSVDEQRSAACTQPWVADHDQRVEVTRNTADRDRDRRRL